MCDSGFVVFLGILFYFIFGYFWEWFVHERLRLKIFLAYKSSLRDSISRWTPCGKALAQILSEHENQVFETRFISPKSSL